MMGPAASPPTKKRERMKGGVSDRVTAWRNRELRRPLHLVPSDVH